MLPLVLKCNFLRTTLPAMASFQGVPIQYLSESDNLQHQTNKGKRKADSSLHHGDVELFKSVSPIGFITSCFKSKNGTPRQPSVCTFSRAKLEILNSTFLCPDHSLEGLQQFSHVWLMFLFHKNGGVSFTKAKVKPPRLNGAKVGVFATRSPHRPNPIGLTLAKLDKVQGGTLHLSGVDIIDGTPILDIKPYIPAYDNPDNVLHPDKDKQRHLEGEEISDEALTENTLHDEGHAETSTEINVKSHAESGSETKGEVCKSSTSSSTDDQITGTKHGDSDMSSTSNSTRSSNQQQLGGDSSLLSNKSGQDSSDVAVKVADWIMNPPICKLEVQFTNKAEQQLATFKPASEDSSPDDDYTLEFFKNTQEARQAICEILQADPRSTYRREKCSDKLYYFAIDTVHVTCWFYQDIAEVIRIQPLCQADIPCS